MKKKLIVLIIAIIAIIGLGGLYAYLTDTDTKTNVFTVGKVKIELLEANWDQSLATNLKPGNTIDKDPAIKNIGKNQAYVYIKVVNPIVKLMNNTEEPLFNYTINNGWTQIESAQYCNYQATTYYYDTALNANSTTPALFDEVTLNNFSNDTNTIQDMIIYGYAIQTRNLGSSTIPQIFNNHFSGDISETGITCNSALDCNNNPIYSTKPSSLSGLAKIMAENAYPDNGKSEYVTSCNGVDFSKISSDTNGKGIYEIASTKNDPYPIYYYRGAVNNNNVKFAGFCWKAIRTTDTGGVKLIYNGEPDGSGNCTNKTGTSTQIGTNTYNSSSSSLVYVGYMYLNSYQFENEYNTLLNTPDVYGKDVTYSGGTYTLTDTMTSTGTWINDYNTLNNHHYTCFSTGTTCTDLYYIYYTDQTYAYYIKLTSGKKVEDALDEMFTNTTDSTAKSTIDNWYNTNLSIYTSYIEDTVYCNDRSISELNGWDPNGGDTGKHLHFSPYTRINTNHTPSLTCPRTLDRFTVSSSKGNGKLTYPVGLITADEVMYAGTNGSTNNRSYYLYTNQYYWTISPYSFPGFDRIDTAVPQLYIINTNGSFLSIYPSYSTYGIRPVISIKSTVSVESGDGTSTNPFVIQTS